MKKRRTLKVHRRDKFSWLDLVEVGLVIAVFVSGIVALIPIINLCIRMITDTI